MADPVTWALIFAGIAAVGAVAGGTTAIVQGVQANNAAKQNAAIQEQNAKAAEQQAEFEADLKRRQFARLQGEQFSKMGVSGATMEGSPLEIITQSAVENEMDIMNTLYKGKIAGWNYNNEADVQRYKGTMALTNGIGEGTSTILTGIGKAGAGLTLPSNSSTTNLGDLGDGSYYA